MDTHGHESVSKIAGMPLLEKALGKKQRSIQSFYLGNWLTDVSQAIDPVAYSTGTGQIKGMKDSIEEFLDEWMGTVFTVEDGVKSKFLKSLRKELDAHVKNYSKELTEKVDFLTTSDTHDRDSYLAKFFRDTFFMMGYFKFVHPISSNGKRQMDFECYKSVFGIANISAVTPGSVDSRGASKEPPAQTSAYQSEHIDLPGSYSQYYPHEHLDRPEILPSQSPPIYAPFLQEGKMSGPRSSKQTQTHTPSYDLYSYLRDDIEMTAGLLAEVDMKFKVAFKDKIDEDDIQWNKTLAKLGHALHQVEDFFAHSNWIELVATTMGSDFISEIIPPEVGNEWIDRANTIFQKRLKQHLTVPKDNWKEHPSETWVVTGFFDFRDTIISLAHLTEELWGGDVLDPYYEGHALYQKAKKTAKQPEKAVIEVQKFMRHTLDFLTNPKKALKDENNLMAKKLEKEFGSDIKTIRRPLVSEKATLIVLEETQLFQGAPREIVTTFTNLLIVGSKVHTVNKLSSTIYETISEITDFIKKPVNWIIEKLPKLLQEKVKDALKFYARERFYDWIGASRIGSHSLLAKDNGHEPFFKQQKECATAVHWYIVHSLLRWKDNPDAYYIDWLELLEYYLHHPLAYKTNTTEMVISVPVLVSHTVTYKEQLKSKDIRYSLEDKYRATSVNPNTFTWKDIADANFNTGELSIEDTQKAINAILRDSGWGIPVAGPNYAFKPGLVLKIPQQKYKVEYIELIDDLTPWFIDVLKKDWKVIQKHSEGKVGADGKPIGFHRFVEISADEIALIDSRGKNLRQKARNTYRPF